MACGNQRTPWSRLYSLLPLWHRNTKKAKKRGEMLSHPSIELMPDGVGARRSSRSTIILIIIISGRGGSTSSPRRRATMSIHAQIEVLEHLISNGRNLPSRCSHRLHLRARRRNRSIPCSHELTLSPPCLLVQGKTLMCNIIGIPAHLPQAGEETRGTALGAPRVAQF